MFKKILIANRGEIAVRVVRACRELGISPVVVYSDVDRAALHVRKADEAYHIGPATASESYLNVHKLLEVARKSGAEAVHPGYGFLSENPGFNRACRDAGIKFIGPMPEAMELMGSKTRARQTMEKAGVPFVPGTTQGLDSLEQARGVAAKIGYPVMLKAAGGGGGKGMRAVRTPEELASALEQAKSEAMRSFKDDEVYIEKLIVNPRHIEVQILGDEHGNLVHLGERECSVQRRHQKVLEESPSAFVDPEMRRRMGETAVRVGKAAAYSNAGTVEFLVDEQKNFYFLEVNARLQVEHPVTEFVTGLDLVHLQIRIAAGEKLRVRQEDIALRGHAIECRVYAEDPDNNYMPSPGTITRLLQPSGPGIRRDSGVYEGWTVPIDYDPLLAKVIGYAPTRGEAIARLDRAMYEYFVGGIKTNISLFRRILHDPDFIGGKVNTGYLDRLLERHKHDQHEARDGDRNIAAVAAVLFAQMENGAAAPAATRPATGGSANGTAASNWKRSARLDALRGD
jgi:acetyl-CoA carboxylase biotin carboxylase subunit